MTAIPTDKDHHDALSMESIEAELAKFEAEERARLGLPTNAAKQWLDEVPNTFTAKQRAHTTLLVSGLTMAHDLFIQAALRGIGYQVRALDVPDNDALQYGREYGNRGQCNPTYFTVGNLVKYLDGLREQGMKTEDIVKNHVFLTAGACGPCRFGTYVTEYRKALRDSGFDGFRVLLFQQTGGLKQATGDEVGLKMDPTFFWAISRAIFIGDALNALGYRIRPYEVVPGSTDRALEQAKGHIAQAFAEGTSVVKALFQARKLLGAVKVDKLKVKPKVGIIGEFWAMTTEGDGNYGLQRFLEGEGAEVDIQLVAAWILYMIWQGRHDTKERSTLRGTDKKKDATGGSKFSLEGVDVRKRMVSLWAGEKILRGFFGTIAKALGLNDFHLSDQDMIAQISHAFYDNNLRGGEGHMEVGKLIQNVAYSEGQHDPVGEAVRLHAELVGVRRHPVADHRAVPAGDLPADRDQRRRRGQRLLARPDAALQGQAGGAEGGRQGPRRRRHDHGRGPRLPRPSTPSSTAPSTRARTGRARAPPTWSTRSAPAATSCRSGRAASSRR
jgi:predicted nucleotide-binding protein (sugar kinase/HSP70/actin superfamily)